MLLAECSTFLLPFLQIFCVLFGMSHVFDEKACVFDMKWWIFVWNGGVLD